jgi:gluconolactonase
MRAQDPRFSNIAAGLMSAAALSVAAMVAAQPTPTVPTMRGDGPPPAAKPFSITRLDPALDALVAPNAKAELLASGFGLNEGPVWVREGRSGYLLVGGLLDNVIYKVAADKTVSVFLEQAGYTGTDVDHVGAQTRSGRSHVLLIGPSCASLDSEGRLIWCADNDRTVMRLEKDGSRTVLSAGLNGKRFSGPNDIVVTSQDAIYLTDNDFGLRGAGRSPDKEMPNGIWLIKDVAINRWQEAGLLKPSVFKPVITTITRDCIVRRLGRLASEDRAALLRLLRSIVGE